MIYIKKGKPKDTISKKMGAIKRTKDWKQLSDSAPDDEIGANRYRKALRTLFDQYEKDALRETLCKEQHYLCAYCMRRIRNDLHTKIEHWCPLGDNKYTAIEYKNFLGVCSGSYSYGDGHVSQCCDSRKGNRAVQLDPGNSAMMDQIMYESDGTIYFEQSDGWSVEQVTRFNNELNLIFELNGPVKNPCGENANELYTDVSELKSRRAEVLAAARRKISDLRKKDSKYNVKVRDVQKLVDRIEEMDEYPEYAGVLLSYYKNWIKRHKVKSS